MTERILFDIYGRFEVTTEQATDGAWMLYLPGSDGKRRRLSDVIVDDYATLDEIERQLEAVFHEIGTPGTSLTHIEARSPSRGRD